MKENNRFERRLSELISFCDRKADPDAVVKNLIAEIGPGAIFRAASFDELAMVDGVGKSTAMTLRLVGALMSRRITERVTTGKKYTGYEIERYLVGRYLGRTVETVLLLSFDIKDRLLAVDFMGEGTIVSSDTYPRKILEFAIRRGAHHVVLAHNHPGGVALPSEQDLSATARLYNVLYSGGIILSSHFVVSDFDIYRIDPSNDTLFGSDEGIK